ncbi:hypothetical protein G9A89_020720 [Geosiphon pyriformis]|nr:hypothetical protein G9A89_020720 [Geosiphon pyriformis]
MTGLFSKEAIKNTAEVVGISNLKDNVASLLADDVEYRINEIIQEATKFMHHSKRTKLTGEDINNALRIRNVEPLYGFNIPNLYKFERLSTNTIDLYYLEDDELDFENIIDIPLPKVPQEATYTAHWLAVEGVQPSTPHNPITFKAPEFKIETSETNIINEGNMFMANGLNDAESKPIVKHPLSQEHQKYYDTIVNAALTTGLDDQLRTAAYHSLRSDPGIHQLLPHFVKFICEKVEDNIRNLEILDSMMNMTLSLLENKNFFLDPYLHQLIPSVLTCLVSKRLGTRSSEDHWVVRDLSAKIIASIVKRYRAGYSTLQPRITKTLLLAFLDPSKEFSTHYGGIVGLVAMGSETIKMLLLPNLKTYGELIKTERERGTPLKKNEAERCFQAIVDALQKLGEDLLLSPRVPQQHLNSNQPSLEEKLKEKIGDLFADGLIQAGGNQYLMQEILDCFSE